MNVGVAPGQVPSTYLTIQGVQVVQNHARELKMDLRQTKDGGEVVWLANGRRYSLARKLFRKYEITISGSNECPPAISHLWRGSVVMIGSIRHMEIPGDIADADIKQVFGRDPVADSVRRFVLDESGEPIQAVHGTPGIFMTRMRPLLKVMIDTNDSSQDEWGATVDWTLTGTETE
jgi:hypothetical protein